MNDLVNDLDAMLSSALLSYERDLRRDLRWSRVKESLIFRGCMPNDNWIGWPRHFAPLRTLRRAEIMLERARSVVREARWRVRLAVRVLTGAETCECEQ